VVVVVVVVVLVLVLVLVNTRGGFGFKPSRRSSGEEIELASVMVVIVNCCKKD